MTLIELKAQLKETREARQMAAQEASTSSTTPDAPEATGHSFRGRRRERSPPQIDEYDRDLIPAENLRKSVFHELFSGKGAKGGKGAPAGDLRPIDLTQTGFNSAPPYKSDLSEILRRQVEREATRDSRPKDEHRKNSYPPFTPVDNEPATPKDDGDRPVDLPSYSQAYDTKEPAARQPPIPRTLAQPVPIPAPTSDYLAPLKTPMYPRYPMPPIPNQPNFAPNDEPNFVPLPRTALFPNQPKQPTEGPMEQLKRIEAAPLGTALFSPRPAKGQLSTEETVEKLRKEFDGKLESLEARIDIKLGVDGGLRLIRELELMLKKSEAEKEEYKKRYIELERKMALVGAARRYM
jgi:hypothetical protein